MKIIVVGNGKIGELLVQQLSREGHEVVVVDSNPARLEFMQEKLDVAVVPGNGASIEILREAGADSADLLIAVTNSDEVNLLTALVAEKLGCNYTVARVRSPEYDREMNLLKTSFGINVSINPEKTCAKEIFRLLQFPTFLTRNSFAGGRAEMVELIVPEEGKLTGRKLSELTNILDKKALICTIERNGEVLVPSGSTELRAGDKLGLAAATADLPALLHRFGIRTLDVKNVMIMGGGNTTVRTVDTMPEYIDAKIIELSMERCEHLNELLEGDKTLVINGDGRDVGLLNEEGIKNTQAFVALTGNAETNILACLTAKRMGVRKTVAMVDNLNYMSMAESLDIGTIINKRIIAAGKIYQMMLDADVMNVTFLTNADADVAEFIPKEGCKITRKDVKDLGLPPGVTIGGLVRNGEGMLVSGNTQIQAGDSVMVFCSDINIKRVEKLFI